MNTTRILRGPVRWVHDLARADGDEAGATAIEYALIAGLVAVVLIGALSIVGTNVSDMFTGVANEVAEATPDSE
jgi:pilus assembly protein Flp/PilA